MTYNQDQFFLQQVTALRGFKQGSNFADFLVEAENIVTEATNSSTSSGVKAPLESWQS